MSSVPLPKPWFRQPWPWVLIALPGSVVVAGIVTMVLAFQGADGLVADDYYKRGMGINRTLARETRATELGITGEVRFTESGVQASLGPAPVLPPSIRLTLAHPTRASSDRVVHLARTAGGEYAVAAGDLPKGRWNAVLETAEWRLAAVVDTRRTDRVRLGP